MEAKERVGGGGRPTHPHNMRRRRGWGGEKKCVGRGEQKKKNGGEGKGCCHQRSPITAMSCQQSIFVHDEK